MHVFLTDASGDQISEADCAAVLAHELRHHLHTLDDCFFHYYRGLIPEKEAVEDEKARVERDCNSYAAALCRRLGAPPSATVWAYGSCPELTELYYTSMVSEKVLRHEAAALRGKKN